MNSIKSLVSGVTAIALVAGIGLAYAQTSTSDTTPAAQPTSPAMPAAADRQRQPSGTPSAADSMAPANRAAPMDSTPGTATTPSTSSTPPASSMDAPVERAPRADRN